MIEDLIAAGESSVLEFKSSFDRQVIETLAAFANSKGGTVLVGVNDRGEIVGVALGQETAQQWINQVKSSTAPSIIPDVEALVVDGKTVARISISEYPVKPVSCKGKYYKRINNSNHQLSLTEISDLHLQTFNTSWDYYADRNRSPGRSPKYQNRRTVTVQQCRRFGQADRRCVPRVRKPGRSSEDVVLLNGYRGSPSWSGRYRPGQGQSIHHAGQPGSPIYHR